MFLSLLEGEGVAQVTETLVEKTQAIGYTGFTVAMIGVALCVLLCGIGSAIGLYKTGTAAAGV